MIDLDELRHALKKYHGSSDIKLLNTAHTKKYGKPISKTLEEFGKTYSSILKKMKGVRR